MGEKCSISFDHHKHTLHTCQVNIKVCTNNNICMVYYHIGVSTRYAVSFEYVQQTACVQQSATLTALNYANVFEIDLIRVSRSKKEQVNLLVHWLVNL